MKLLITEEGFECADEIWDGADELLTCRMTYVEIRAALAAARRDGRISRRLLAAARAGLTARWQEITVLELDEGLAAAAGEVAEDFRLRTNDALHLAAALEVGDPALVVTTWDERLRTAALEAGLAVAP